jgi:IstB-like ATP binding protein
MAARDRTASIFRDRSRKAIRRDQGLFSRRGGFQGSLRIVCLSHGPSGIPLTATRRGKAPISVDFVAPSAARTGSRSSACASGFDLTFDAGVR